MKVTDCGSGINADVLPHIFEPFYTTKRTGLGLSMIYGIMKQTGGYVFLDSIVAEGCCFTLLFPAHYEPNPNKSGLIDRVSRTAVPVPADGIVLLVDNEAPVLVFAARALWLRGYMVLEADCGERALEILEDVDLWVDIFVTDVIMVLSR